MITLYQYKNGYRYNSDTIFLYDFISSKKPKGKVLDVGSGCGVLGLLIKRDFENIELFSIDIQDKNSKLTQKNADVNSLEVKVLNGDFLNYDFEERFDFVISNPPFYNQGAKKSEDRSLYLSRHSDALPFYDFAKKVYAVLKPKGSFVFCYDAKQTDIIFSSLLELRFKVNSMKFIHPKREKDASLIMVEARRESKSLSRVEPPLVVFDEDRYSLEAQKIFEKARTNSVDL